MSSSESEIGSPEPPPFDPQNVTEEQLLDIVNDAEHADGDIRKLALTRARLISSVHNNLEEAIDKLINCGLVAVLVHHLDTEGYEVKLEAAWTLSNIASGNSKQTKVVIESGAVEKLIKLLSCPNHTLSEQSLWALANILGDGHEGRDYVLNLGALDVVLSLLSPERGSQFRETLSWFVVNIFRDTKSPPTDDIIIRTLPIVHMLMYEKISMVANDMVWSLIYLAQLGERYIQMIIDAALIPHVIHQFNFGTHQVEMAALDAMIALFNGSKTQVEYIVKCGALQHLANEFSYSGRKCMKVLEALENLLRSSPAMVSEVLGVGLGPLLLDKITEQLAIEDQSTYARIIAAIWESAVESNKAQLLLDWDLISGMIPRLPFLKPSCQEFMIRKMSSVFLDLDDSPKELGELCHQVKLEDEDGLLSNLGKRNREVAEEMMGISVTISQVLSGTHEPRDNFNQLSLKMEGKSLTSGSVVDGSKMDRTAGIEDQKFVVVACEKCGPLHSRTSSFAVAERGTSMNSGDGVNSELESMNTDAPSTSGEQQSLDSDAPSTSGKQQSLNSDAPSTSDKQQVVNSDAPSTSGEQQSMNSDAPSTSGGQQSMNSVAPSTSGEQQSMNSDAPSTSGGQQSMNSDAPSTSGGQQSMNSVAPSTSGEQQSMNSDAPSTSDKQQVVNSDAPSTSGEQQSMNSDAPSTSGGQQSMNSVAPSTSEQNPVNSDSCKS